MTKKSVSTPGEKDNKLLVIRYNFDEEIDREGTDCIKFDLRKQYFGTENVQPMWVADMDFAIPPFIRDAVIKRAMHPVYGYTSRPASFNNSVIRWMKLRFDWDVKDEWISFSPGVVPALNLCVLAYTKPGDGIIVQPPVYYPFFKAVKDHKRKILFNQLVEKKNKYYIDFEDFEEKASQATMFILCHPHNPVGRVWTKDDLQKIIDICKKYNVLILSDEIHSDLNLSGFKHIPLATLSDYSTGIITCTAPSKTFNLAGLSTSILIIQDKILKSKYDRILDHMHIGMGNIFGNLALEVAYNYGEEWLSQLLEYIEGNYLFLKQFIENKIPELLVTPLEATYLVWIDFRKLPVNSKKLKDFVIQKAELGLSDGPIFGPGGEGFQRMNIAVPRIKLEEALNKLERAISELRKS